MKKAFLLALVALMAATCLAQEKYGFNATRNISYLLSGSDRDAYSKERCVLDVYAPSEQAGEPLPVVVFFHGGGLTGGKKFLPMALRHQKMVVVTPNYRLSPKATAPAYIFDAAEAVAWTVSHIAQFGGDPSRIIVTGHSAGGYLTLMLALNKSYLARFGVDADAMAAYVPLSGQTNTHYTIRGEKGLSQKVPFIDEYAPLANGRKLGTRMILMVGDRKTELAYRVTENEHLQELLRRMGNDVPLYELHGYDHGEMLNPALYQVIRLAQSK